MPLRPGRGSGAKAPARRSSRASIARSRIASSGSTRTSSGVIASLMRFEFATPSACPAVGGGPGPGAAGGGAGPHRCGTLDQGRRRLGLFAMRTEGIDNLKAILRRSRWILVVFVLVGAVQMNLLRNYEGPLYSAQAQVILADRSGFRDCRAQLIRRPDPAAADRAGARRLPCPVPERSQTAPFARRRLGSPVRDQCQRQRYVDCFLCDQLLAKSRSSDRERGRRDVPGLACLDRRRDPLQGHRPAASSVRELEDAYRRRCVPAQQAPVASLGELRERSPCRACRWRDEDSPVAGEGLVARRVHRTVRGVARDRDSRGSTTAFAPSRRSRRYSAYP